MKNRIIHLLALFFVILVFSPILPAPAAGARASMPLPEDCPAGHLSLDSPSVAQAMATETPEGAVTPMLAAGAPVTEFATGKPALALAGSQCTLNISSTAGGSVTIPGEGNYTYDKGMVVDLVAEPEEGHRFVNWTGDVNTIGNVTASSTDITMDGDYSITANFVEVEAGAVGIKAGDWIKLTYNITGWPAGQPYREWLKVEFASVNGAMANVQVTLHISDGNEQTGTVPVDIASGSDVPTLAGIVIAANRTTGDPVYIVGYGNLAIEGEATRNYAGADRAVVYGGFAQNETQVEYYWDKLTGVMVEVSSASSTVTGTLRATETNMWGATTAGMPWWPWVIVGAAVVAGVAIFFVRRRGRSSAPTQDESPH